MATRGRTKQSIVVGTDFSKVGELAFERGVAIARASSASLHVVHAHPRLPRALVDLVRGRDETVERKALATLLRRARAAKVRVRGHRVEGTAMGVLRAKAREVDAGLLVVGARGRTVPDSFIGSTAERIAAQIRVPVLLVRNPGQRPYVHVLVAADGESNLPRMLAAAAIAAPTIDLAIVHAYQDPYETTLVLHGVPAPQIAKYRRETLRRARTTMLERLADAGVDSARLVLRHGDARRVLLREEQHRRHVLFVIDRGKSALAHFFLGSTTRALVAHATSDVLIT